MRRALLASALLLGALVPALAAGPARAAAIGQCAATRGSIVAVDFAHFGGPLVRGCGVTSTGGPDASGLALLEDGGFTPVGTTQYGLAFICRLGDAAFAGGTAYPTTKQTPCNQTPPASASWSYWLAEPGATAWTYSPEGATSDRPVSGEVELWTFGSGATPPSSEIGELRAANPTVTAPGTPTPTKAAPTTAAPPPTSPANSSTGTSARPPSPVAPATTAHPSSTGPGVSSAVSSGVSSAASGSGVSSSAAVGAAGASSPAPPPLVDSVAGPATRHAGGSPLPVILTAVLVALLAAGAGVAAWQRRRGESPSAR